MTIGKSRKNAFIQEIYISHPHAKHVNFEMSFIAHMDFPPLCIIILSTREDA